MNSQLSLGISTLKAKLFLLILLGFFLALPLQIKAMERDADISLISANQPNFIRSAKNLPVGGRLVLTDIPIMEMRGNQRLRLERFSVFARDAVIVTDRGEHLPVPDNAYYRGQVEGLSDSTVLLTIPEQGQPRGLIFTGGRVIVIDGGATERPSGLNTREIDVETELGPLGRKFRCGTETLHRPEDLLREIASTAIPVENFSQIQTTGGTIYTVNLALETDYEYYALFNNQTAALNYLSDLIGYASVIYEREIGARLQISYTKLWTNGPDSDPWNNTSSVTTILGELLAYWNQNNSNVNRATVHMLSGKRLNSGVAYVGALCSNQYGYGVSSSIQGNFRINNPAIVWDIVAVSHELGHNFNSEHTHCYAGTGGNSNDVDHCYGQQSGCYQGPRSLPGINSLTGGAAGSGTIMSYCHLLPGGFSNLSMTFGQNHPYGIAADRVPQVMSSFVVARAPSCLSSAGYPLTVLKAGTGTGRVSGTGIDCGADCAESYAVGTNVTLTATPNAGSTFTSWSGACSGTGTCTVAMTAARAVTATFTAGGGGGLTLDEALDNAALAWQTSSNVPWSGVQLTDRDAARSGTISHNQGSALQTTVTGPGTLSFQWKVSSEPDYDYLSFYLDGVLQFQISGAVSWQSQSVTVGSGTHQLRWEYRKDGSVSVGEDTGWVDAVTWSAGSASHLLTVLKAGTGTGRVSGTGIDCGADCAESYAVGTNVTLTATPNAGSTFTSWSGACSGTGTCTVAMTAARAVTATFTAGGGGGLTLDEALDNAALAWQTSSNVPWSGVQLTDRDAARSGTISHNQGSALQTTVTGPGTLSFQWKVSSEPRYDYLSFYLDGVLRFRISGAVNWQSQSVTVGSGAHQLRWEYRKDGSVSVGEDAGWVDAVTYQ